MSRTLVLVSGLLIMCAVEAEVVQEIDRRAIKDDAGYWVVFVSRPASEGNVAGYALAALGKGENSGAISVESAYGLTHDDDQPAVGLVKADTVSAVRSEKKLPEAHTLIVQVDAKQYDSAKKLVEKWSTRISEDDPDVTALNFVENLIPRINLKAPFRPVLSRANPHAYFDDLAKLNRDK